MTIKIIKELAKKPIVEHPGLYGRDDSNPYYDFLYHLAQEMKPKIIVELGTWKGDSTCRLAYGAPEAKVITVDIGALPEAYEKTKKFDNIEMVKGGSLDNKIIDYIPDEIDILFIDTLHDYEQVMAEYIAYSPKVKKGGVILYDDVIINKGMEMFWEEVSIPKINLPELHYTGFGISIKI